MERLKVKIYQPAKTAMQSGKSKTKRWVLEYTKSDVQYIEPVMNWTGTEGVRSQVKLYFDTQQEAIDFANDNGFDYELIEPKPKKTKPKSYMSNFATDLKR